MCETAFFILSPPKKKKEEDEDDDDNKDEHEHEHEHEHGDEHEHKHEQANRRQICGKATLVKSTPSHKAKAGSKETL